MKTITFHPKDEAEWLDLRVPDLTSTTVAALFGLHPRVTKFELWYAKNAGIPLAFEETERTRWGRRMESVIAEGAAEERGWQVEKIHDYVRAPDVRLGASFDYLVLGDEPEILECKNVDGLVFRNEWASTEFGLESPIYIEIQLQVQLLLKGYKRGYIVPLVGGNRHEVLPREFDPEIGARILEECEAFWKLKTAPDPDFTRDAAFIGQLYKYAEPGKVINATTRLAELLVEYDETGKQIREFDKHRESVRAEIFTIAPDAERIEFDGGYALAKTQAECVVESFTRRASRPLRVYGGKSK